MDKDGKIKKTSGGTALDEPEVEECTPLGTQLTETHFTFARKEK